MARLGCRAIRFMHKLPVQEWHGHHAAPAQVADKANAASVPQAGAYPHLPQRPSPGTGKPKWAVTASRSDGPAQASNNAGERHILLCAADVMMAAYTDRELPRPMGFVHRQPQQRRFLQALAQQGGTAPGMPRPRSHTGPTHGRSLLPQLAIIPCAPPGALSLAAIIRTQCTGFPPLFLIPLTSKEDSSTLTACSSRTTSVRPSSRKQDGCLIRGSGVS